MKLLLTSAGITNKTIANALRKLVGRPFKELNLTFVITAANVESGGKEWLIDDLYRIKKLGFKKIEIVDIAMPEKEVWLPQIEEADVIVFSGGNTFYFLNQLEKSGLDKLLPAMLKTKVYVGISAGSIATTTKFPLNFWQQIYSEKTIKLADGKTLGLVNFSVFPHLNSSWFPQRKVEILEKQIKPLDGTIYALDDQSAVVVNGENISVVSEGKWQRFN